jgi:alpha-L-rhamnosidase
MPGFKSFVLQPEPDPTGQITWAQGHYESVYGTIESAWHVEAGQLTYTTTVPANTTATLKLPTRSPMEVRETGKPTNEAAGVVFERFDSGAAVYRLGSGTYRFTAPL